MRNVHRRPKSTAFLHGSMMPYAVRPIGVPRPGSNRAVPDSEALDNPRPSTQSSFYVAVTLFLGLTFLASILLVFLPF